jgi:cytidylate kinase
METVIGRIVIDGHSASGKSTVAAIVAARLGGTVVHPFGDSEAAELLGLTAGGRFEDFERRAQEMLAQAEKGAGRVPAVFDRHWVTVAAHLPEPWRRRWPAVPRTYVCWADLETTERRLLARMPHNVNRDFHSHFLGEYRGLAERLGVPLIDTSRMTGEEAAARILADISAGQ